MHDVRTVNGFRCEVPAGPLQVDLDPAAIVDRLQRVAGGTQAVDAAVFTRDECRELLEMVNDDYEDGALRNAESELESAKKYIRSLENKLGIRLEDKVVIKKKTAA